MGSLFVWRLQDPLNKSRRNGRDSCFFGSARWSCPQENDFLLAEVVDTGCASGVWRRVIHCGNSQRIGQSQLSLCQGLKCSGDKQCPEKRYRSLHAFHLHKSSFRQEQRLQCHGKFWQLPLNTMQGLGGKDRMIPQTRANLTPDGQKQNGNPRSISHQVGRFQAQANGLNVSACLDSLVGLQEQARMATCWGILPVCFSSK